jgi:hypothetical protein
VRNLLPFIVAATGLALLSAAPIPSQVPPQLAFQYEVGQSFRYREAGGHTSTFKHAEHGVSDYVVRIESRDAKGWHASERVSMGGKSKSFPITISETGAWTSDADGTFAANLVSFDPRRFCLPPNALALHATWQCERLGTRLHPAGTETIAVTALSADGVTLDVSGSTPDKRDTRIDPDNGGTVDLHSRTTWRQSVTFSHGRQVRLEERAAHMYNVPGSNVRAETIVNNLITSE